jgi:hypothetical protein
MLLKYTFTEVTAGLIVDRWNLSQLKKMEVTSDLIMPSLCALL